MRPRKEEDSDVEEVENLSEDGDSSAPSEGDLSGGPSASEDDEASDDDENVSSASKICYILANSSAGI